MSYINNNDLGNSADDAEEPKCKIRFKSLATAFGDQFQNDVALHDIVDNKEEINEWEIRIPI